jgi:Kef-type K+ transport system membrane component KefB
MMAALGLSSDPRVARSAGRSVTIVAALSLTGIVVLGVLQVRALGI